MACLLPFSIPFYTLILYLYQANKLVSYFIFTIFISFFLCATPTKWNFSFTTLADVFLFIFRVFSSVYRLHMFHPAARISKYSENGSEMCFSLKKHPTSARFYIKCKMCSAYSFSVMWCLHFELKVWFIFFIMASTICLLIFFYFYND